MPEHYTQATESVTRWCNRCGRPTQHAVSSGRPGRCLEHQVQELTQAQVKRREQQAREARQPRLFPKETA